MKTQNPVTYSNIFSFGDTCLTPSNEPKGLLAMALMAHQVSHNILQVVNGTHVMLPIPTTYSTVQVTPISSKAGVFSINKMVKESKTAIKDKNGWRDEGKACLTGKTPFVKTKVAQVKQFTGMNNMFSGCCSCLPMHYSKVRDTKAKQLKETQDKYNQLYSQ